MMRGKQSDIAAFIAREGFHPINPAAGNIRTRKRRMRQGCTNGGLEAAIFRMPGGIIISARAMTRILEQIRLIADLQRQKTVTHRVRNGLGFLHRVVEPIAAQVEAPYELPADSVQKPSQLAEILRIHNRALGKRLGGAIGLIRGKIRGVAADAYHALRPQIAHQLDVSAIVRR